MKSTFTINNLVDLSSHLNTLQQRLLASLKILKYLDEKDNLRFEIDIKTWDVEESNVPENLSIELKNSLSIFPQFDMPNETTVEELSINKMEFLQTVAVITYMICFGSNPYLGELFYDRVVISDKWLDEYFGYNRSFSFDSNKQNLPDPFYQERTTQLWNHTLNKDIRNNLEAYFTNKDYKKANDIRKVMYEMLAKLNTSPKGPKICLKNDINPDYTLMDGKYFLDSKLNILGKAFMRSGDRTDICIKNETNYLWEVRTATGKELNIGPNQEMPIRKNMVIRIPKTADSWTVD